MPELPPPPERIDDDTVRYIDSLLADPEAGGHMRTQMTLKALLTTPKSNFQRALRHDITSDPNKMAEVLKKTTPEDFRAFLRDEILDKEKENIPETLAILREADPKEYNKVLQGWAKLALPTQKETDINVNIRQKADMYSRIQKQYGLSRLIEDVQPLPDDEQPPTAEPEPVLVETPEAKVVRPYDMRAAIDPTFFDTNEEPTDQPNTDYDPLDNPVIDEQDAEDLPY